MKYLIVVGCCNEVEVQFTSPIAPWMLENTGIFSFSGKDDKGYNIYKSKNGKILFRHNFNYWLVSIYLNIIANKDLKFFYLDFSKPLF